MALLFCVLKYPWNTSLQGYYMMYCKAQVLGDHCHCLTLLLVNCVTSAMSLNLSETHFP